MNELDKSDQAPEQHSCLVYDPLEDTYKEVKIKFTEQGAMVVNGNIQYDTPSGKVTPVSIDSLLTGTFAPKPQVATSQDWVTANIKDFNGMRNLEVEDHQWKTKEPFNEKFVTINWLSFSSQVTDLRFDGWEVDIVTNLVTKKKKLYIRHPILKLVGRCNYEPGKDNYTMEFLTPERNQRMKPPRVEIEREVPTITQENIPMILEEIAKVQSENKPKRRRKITQSEILEFVRKIA